MFDIGFWELALIGVIGLLVIGPERLPGVARTLGIWVGKLQRFVRQTKMEIKQELHTEALMQEAKALKSSEQEISAWQQETEALLTDINPDAPEKNRVSVKEQQS